MADVKLFVCCHQPTDVPKHPLLVPIQVGAALADHHFPGFLYDDTGDNISMKNRSYCELTAQYWAWKNIDVDYYGFFHYRRYLYPDMSEKKPYRIEKKATLPLLKKLGYDYFAEIIQSYDVLLPQKEEMYLPVRMHYRKSPFHHKKDLEEMEVLIQKISPEYTVAAEQYLSQTACYFGNIFIMKKTVFFHYCRWLFRLLEEFDCKRDTTNYNQQEKRVNGYLAERLLGIYINYHLKSMRILEIPGLHFFQGTELVERCLLNVVLPPGSRRRAVVKELIN